MCGHHCSNINSIASGRVGAARRPHASASELLGAKRPPSVPIADVVWTLNFFIYSICVYLSPPSLLARFEGGVADRVV